MSNEIRIQDDLYHAVNGEWLKNAVIPDDRPTTGGFAELDEEVEKLLRNDFASFAKGEKEIPLPELKEAVKLYNKVLDVKRRDEEGVKPILPYLKEIEDIKDVADLNKKAKSLILDGVDLPFSFGVDPNMKNTEKNAFILTGPSIILPDTTYYAEDNAAGKQLLEVFKNMAKAILAKTPLKEEEQEKYIEDTLAFDALIAKQVKSQLEWADYVANYNPMSTKEVASLLEPFDFLHLLKEFYGESIPQEVIVYDPKAIRNFREYFNEETFSLYKHWAYVNYLIAGAKNLSIELHTLSTTYRRSLYGIAKDPILEKQAYQLVGRVFSEPIGVYYGRTYFGEEAKKDVVSLVKRIIEAYKGRMKKNTFLQEETKEKAILKLDTIAIKMGYPDKIDEFYSSLKVEDEDSLFVTLLKLSSKSILHSLEKLNKPVDRSEWGMPGHMVNACYNPFSNDITFPAAILQKPFYSLKQSESENLGGIGAVIGHEISHAFDNNGASFDEKGNLANWWKEEDYKAFKELTKKMIEEFDGIDFYGGKVNGELIVSENIADNGGMGVTISIMHETKDASFQDYFRNWAKVWCMKAKPQYIQLLLTNDVHAPAELRANMQPRNFEEWYEAFHVTEKDGMYLAPEKRVRIW